MGLWQQAQNIMKLNIMKTEVSNKRKWKLLIGDHDSFIENRTFLDASEGWATAIECEVLCNQSAEVCERVRQAWNSKASSVAVMVLVPASDLACAFRIGP